MEGPDSTVVKIADFGSARLIDSRCPGYVASRYYRAPEVVLGFEHDTAIDIWAIGCVIVEIFLGLPFLCGQNEIQLLELQQQLIGPFPAEWVTRAPKRNVFFLPNGRLKSEEQVCRECGKRVETKYKCFAKKSLGELIANYTVGKGRTEKERKRVAEMRAWLTDLLTKIFEYDPAQRITADEALAHPFLLADLT
jgi:serine/threonine protein kinase